MFESQQRLFDISIQKQDLPLSETKGLRVYQELVYHRFDEVISNCLPFGVKHLGDKKEKLIVEFMNQNPKTPYIWQMPNEFREFLKGRLEDRLPFLDDLLWYEWVEVELFMGKYESLHVRKFYWEKEYTLNSNARIKDLSYKVFEDDIKTKGEFWVLSYYDLKSKDVLFRELNEVLYIYLLLQEEIGSKGALKEVVRLAEADEEDVKEILNEALKTLCEIGVLK